MIELDGSMGEGGGQVLRTALSLSLLTGQPMTLSRVRAGRQRPGLRPQHLAALNGCARISDAAISGDRVGSQRIAFSPGTVRPDEYHLDIGTAGAATLVLQTLLLPLAIAPDASRLAIAGGTHVPWSPCFHYLDRHWRPLLARMGIALDLAMPMAGFHPEGGGEMDAGIPGGSRLSPLQLTGRGALRRIRGLSAVANLPEEIAGRQRRRALQRLGSLAPRADIAVEIESLPARSRGTVLLLLAEFEHSQACFFALGARGKPAERVADEAADALAEFLATQGAVDHWLADQLLLPMALAEGASAVRTSRVTLHLLTNAEVIRRFLPVRIEVDAPLGDPALITVAPSGAGTPRRTGPGAAGAAARARSGPRADGPGDDAMALEGIRAVLLDFGGVVAEEGFRDGLRALAAEQGLDPVRVHREGMRAVYESGFVLGRGTAADFWSLLRRRTGLGGEDEMLTERILAGFRVRPGMLALVRRLRAAGLFTGILSDQTHWLDTLDARRPFKAAFDRVYNSYHLGKGKEDPTLFPEVAADLGLSPPEILFVDDAPGNVERARQAGFRALLFRDEAGFRAAAQSLLVSVPSRK